MLKGLAWGGYALAFASLLLLGALQFVNPDMTRARLVLTYWPLLAVACFGIVVACVAQIRRDGIL